MVGKASIKAYKIMMIMLCRLLRDIAKSPGVEEKILAEMERELDGQESRLEDISNLQYLTACFYESLRTTSAAIVPHMANRDTSIGGNKKKN